MGRTRVGCTPMYNDKNPDGSGDTDVFVRHANDQGATWTAPVRVNDDTGTNSQFLITFDVYTANVAVG